MSDDQRGGAAPGTPGGWQPIAPGEYDVDATGFVELPDGMVQGYPGAENHAGYADYTASGTDGGDGYGGYGSYGGYEGQAGAAGSPLAAPGHGYVPPQITITPAAGESTDPAGTGVWGLPGATGTPDGTGAQGTAPQGPGPRGGDPSGTPSETAHTGAAPGQAMQPGTTQSGAGAPQAVHWPDPNALPQDAVQHPGEHGTGEHGTAEHYQGHSAPYGYDPGVTQQAPAPGTPGAGGTGGPWHFDEAQTDGAGGPGGHTGAPEAAHSDVTGEWSIPVAQGDLPDESGEFTTSVLAAQWGGTPPQTLPGGATAPWAAGGARQSWPANAEPGSTAETTETAEHPGRPVQTERGQAHRMRQGARVQRADQGGPADQAGQAGRTGTEAGAGAGQEAGQAGQDVTGHGVQAGQAGSGYPGYSGHTGTGQFPGDPAAEAYFADGTAQQAQRFPETGASRPPGQPFAPSGHDQGHMAHDQGHMAQEHQGQAAFQEARHQEQGHEGFGQQHEQRLPGAPFQDTDPGERPLPGAPDPHEAQGSPGRPPAHSYPQDADFTSGGPATSGTGYADAGAAAGVQGGPAGAHDGAWGGTAADAYPDAADGSAQGGVLPGAAQGGFPGSGGDAGADDDAIYVHPAAPRAALLPDAEQHGEEAQDASPFGSAARATRPSRPSRRPLQDTRVQEPLPEELTSHTAPEEPVHDRADRAATPHGGPSSDAPAAASAQESGPEPALRDDARAPRTASPAAPASPDEQPQALQDESRDGDQGHDQGHQGEPSRQAPGAAPESGAGEQQDAPGAPGTPREQEDARNDLRSAPEEALGDDAPGAPREAASQAAAPGGLGEREIGRQEGPEQEGRRQEDPERGSREQGSPEQLERLENREDGKTDGLQGDPRGESQGDGAPSPQSSESAESSESSESSETPQFLQDEHPLASYVLRVNGTDRPVTDAWIGESLLYVLRERLGLAGAKDGCAQGECGACNVQVDGRLVASCLVPGAATAGSEVRTVEGLADDGRPSDVQRALGRCGAVQCGFCVPGMAMTVHDLLEGNPRPTELEARQALSGNLCRCSGYRGVLDAVRAVADERRAGAEAARAAERPDGEEAPRIPHQAAGPGAADAPQDPHPHTDATATAPQGSPQDSYGTSQDTLHDAPQGAPHGAALDASRYEDDGYDDDGGRA